MSFWRASRSGFGRWVFPLLLAYALLIQSVIGTLASTEHSVGVAAGFVCEGSAGTDHGPSDGAGHDALCCVFGCTAAAAPALLDPPAPFLLTERDTAVSASLRCPTAHRRGRGFSSPLRPGGLRRGSDPSPPIFPLQVLQETVMSQTFVSRARPLAVAALFSLTAGSASAHVVLAQKEALPGSYQGTLKVGHGCDGSATTAIKVTIPEGVVGVKPQPKAGWTIAIETGPYAKAYPMMHGKPATEGVKTITWSGGNLPDAYYDEFVFVSTLTPDVAARPSISRCSRPARRLHQLGGDAGCRPARAARPPAILKVAQAAASAPAASAQVKVGDLVLDAPWTRATPAGPRWPRLPQDHQHRQRAGQAAVRQLRAGGQGRGA